MRHQSGHVAGRVADAGDRAERAIRVCRIVRVRGDFGVLVDVSEEDLAVAFELVERGVVGVVAALTVGNGNP